MRVVVTGSEGQLGSALKLTCPADIEPVWLGHKDLDITDEAAVARHPAFEGADAIINTAGYTNVDAAETDRDAAWALNASAPGFLARRAAEVGAHLVHLSTDYVFGTVAYRRPLVPDTPTHPSSVYGESKRAGECAVLDSGANSVIVRTAWVFSGAVLPTHRDFVSTMMALEKQHDTISVVDDQHGNPTFAPDLALGLWEVCHVQPTGVLHGVSFGETTWYGVAREVFKNISADPDRVRPCTTADFPRPAARPEWSVLDTSSWTEAGLRALPEWRSGVARATQGTLRQL